MFNGNANDIELKVHENVSLKINTNDIIQGAKDQVSEAIKKAGKQLPSIPKMELQDDEDESFNREYEERKQELRAAQSHQQQNIKGSANSLN